MRMRSLKVDGQNAVAYILGKKLVVATGARTVAKDGTQDDLGKLGDTLTSADLAGFAEVK